MEKPPSDRKVESNRKNAQRSTGPRTPRGKAIASLNAMTHGIFAKKTVAIGPPLLEDPAQFVALLEGLRAHYDPVGVQEDVKVEEIASINWKKVRLERYETAGIAERLSATVAAARSRTDEERFGCIQKGIALGSIGDPTHRPEITATELREQIDLVDRLKAVDARIDEEPDFLAFVWCEKCGGAGEATPPEHNKPEQLKTVLAELPPPELDDLRMRFRSQAEELLQTMWDLRAKRVPHEAAIERSLIPDGEEMGKIMRYSTHLTRLEEKAIAMLERLQAARREKEGRNR
jgi:hypothetical protein